MTTTTDNLPRAQQIRAEYNTLRQCHPELPVRDAAHALGHSEMELIAAGAGGITPTPLGSRPQQVFHSLSSLGRAMALTRNDWCVQERHGCYEDIHAGSRTGCVLGKDLTLRLRFENWGSAWAVNDNGQCSIQFFDSGGTAVHKVVCTENTNMRGYLDVVRQFAVACPCWPTIRPVENTTASLSTSPRILRSHWMKMDNGDAFYSLLQNLKISRVTALRTVGSDLAQQIDNVIVEHMLKDVIRQRMPFVCSVRNHGVIQTHCGAISRLERNGSWFSVLGDDFELNIDTSAITQTWIVHRPAGSDWTTSFECFAANGDQVVQFSGANRPGDPNLPSWHNLMTAFCPEPLAA
ncbi:MAG TPA: ChuX/HutX family heme-like substrate-binding protein [Burkholderiaceae bacterium]|nr:ChuX/HutX family heme-like substrate-binding protein [Burkholderiaceae bacterium]